METYLFNEVMYSYFPEAPPLIQLLPELPAWSTAKPTCYSELEFKKDNFWILARILSKPALTFRTLSPFLWRHPDTPCSSCWLPLPTLPTFLYSNSKDMAIPLLLHLPLPSWELQLAWPLSFLSNDNKMGPGLPSESILNLATRRRIHKRELWCPANMMTFSNKET